MERIHGVIAESLRAMDLESKPYDENSVHTILQAVAWSLRTTHHTQLQASPGQMVFGRDMIINATYLANWRAVNQNKMKRVLYDNARENKRRVDYDYQPGQQVYVINRDIKRKLSPDKSGPFPIVAVHTNGTLTVQRSPTVTERINIRRAHPAP